MSRIGKQPIEITSDVEVVIDGDDIVVKGPKGKLSMKKASFVDVKITDNDILVSVSKKDKKELAFWGLTRSLIANMIEGVRKGYEKNLETLITAFDSFENCETAGRQGKFQYVNTHIAIKMGYESADNLIGKIEKK